MSKEQEILNLLQELKDKKVLINDKKFNQKSQGNLKDNPQLKTLLWELTPFAPENTPYTTRILLLVNGFYDEWPKCARCGGQTNLSRVFEKRGTFATFCSQQCKIKPKLPKNTPEQTKAKREATNLIKYGHKNALGNKEIQEKRKKTNIEKYGVDNLFKMSEWQEIAKQKMIEKYGVENFFKLPGFQEQKKQRCLEKYGVENAAQLPETQEKITKTNLERYGVGRPLQDPTKVRELKSYFYRVYGMHHKQRHISLEMINKLDNIAWLKDQHIIQQKTQTKIAEDLGVSRGLVKQALIAADITPMRHPNSQGERDLGEYIKSLGYDIQTNNRSILHGKELDIFIPSKNIAIEYNGTYFHSTERYDKNYHLDKTTRCEEKGIRLIHLPDYEWLEKNEAVKNWIQIQLGNNDHPTTSSIEEVDQNDARKFFINNWYGEFNFNCTHCFKLEDTYATVLATEDFCVELLQFCGSPYHVCLILEHIKQNYAPNVISTSLDRSKYNSTIALCMGFDELVETTPPILDENGVWNCGFIKWIMKC